MNEHLYSVGMKDKRTGEKINLRIWAKDTGEATRKVCGTLIGPYCEYVWTGSGPLYANNELISRPTVDERA